MITSVEDAPTFNASTTSIDIGNGIMVNPSYNSTITLSCLMQLYNSTGFEAQGNGSIGITGYLEEFVRCPVKAITRIPLTDRSHVGQYAGPTVLLRWTASWCSGVELYIRLCCWSVQICHAWAPDSMKFMTGGLNNQSLAAAGSEANLDTQFGFGISYPIPVRIVFISSLYNMNNYYPKATFYSTAGRAPYKPGGIDSPDTNEWGLPYSINFNVWTTPGLIWIGSTTCSQIPIHLLSFRLVTVTLSRLVRRIQLLDWNVWQSCCSPRELHYKGLQSLRTAWWSLVPYCLLVVLEGLMRVFSRCTGCFIDFSSGDDGVGDGDPNPATQRCFTNDGRNATRFMPNFPPSWVFCMNCDVVQQDDLPSWWRLSFVRISTDQIFDCFIFVLASLLSGYWLHSWGCSVCFFFGRWIEWYRRLGIISDGFIFDLSHQFSRPKYQDKAVSQHLSALPNGTYAGLFNPYVIFYLTILTERQIRLFITGEEECVRYPSDKPEYLPAPPFIGIPWLSQHNPTDTVSSWAESLFWSAELLPPLPLSQVSLEWCSSISRSSLSRIFESLNLLCPGIIQWHHHGPQFWMWHHRFQCEYSADVDVLKSLLIGAIFRPQKVGILVSVLVFKAGWLTLSYETMTGVGTPNFGKFLAHVTSSGCKSE